MTTANRSVDFESMDPGIRDVVAFLIAHGFVTTDSGDGVTKLRGGATVEDGVRDYPHVTCVGSLVEALRLGHVLVAAGVNLVEIGSEKPGAQIQFTLDVATRFQSFDLMGLDSAGLAHAWPYGYSDVNGAKWGKR